MNTNPAMDTDTETDIDTDTAAHPGSGAHTQPLMRSGVASAAIALLLSAAVAHADEFGLLGGQGRSPEVGGIDAAYQIEYQQNINRWLAVGVSYVNEGHAANSHRDGAALQLRGQMALFHPRLIFSVGAGPYTYFDTTRAAPGGTDSVEHGWGMVYSAGVTWEMGNAWYLQGRVQRVDANRGHDATFVLMGAGYRFGRAIHDDSPSDLNRDREIGFYGGKVIANTFQSEDARALALDYRRKVSDTYERSLTLLDESDTGPVRRYGIAGQLWAVRALGSERLTVSGGIGPYLLFKVRDGDRNSGGDRLAGLLSASISYDITSTIRARFLFHRVFARHSRDTDVLLLGLSWVS